MFRRHLIAIAVLLSALPASIRSQEAVMPGVDPDTGVYVPDSAIVIERVALAERMERSREWGKAADLLQEIVEKQGQRIVPFDDGATAGGAGAGDASVGKRYVGAADLVQRRLAAWPAEGLAAYAARYGHVAQAMLDAGPFDPAVLSRVQAEHYVTDAGKVAAMRSVDLALEAGEFGTAAWTADRLATLHPALGDDRPAVLFRAGLAHHLAGNAPAATRYADELKAKHPDAAATVAGELAPLATALAAAMAEPPPAASASVTDAWPMLGGDPSRGRPSRAAGRAGARLFGIDLSPPNFRGIPREQREVFGRRFNQPDPSPDPAPSGVMPAIDRGELFFHDGQRAYGVSLDSGVPLPGWSATYPGELAGRYVLEGEPVVGPPRGRQLNVTVTDDAVLAVMGQGDAQMLLITGRAPEARLVCLDRRTGARRWVATASQLPDEAMKSMSLGGSPLVVGDSVYVTGRSSKQQNFEDCYVLCFALADGRPRWQSYVSGATVAGADWDGVPVMSSNEAHVAYAGGRLFVSTNLGAVAALDAYSGGLVWLTTYPRGGAEAFGAVRMNARGLGGNGGATPGTGGPAPWTYNPPVVRDGHVFAMPSDGRDVLVLDAGTGAVRNRILSRHVGGLDTLAGVTGDAVVLAGNTSPFNDLTATVVGIDWRRYDAATFRPGAAREPSVTVRRVLAGGGPLRGRPFLADDALFLPTERRLFCLNLTTNTVMTDGTYPPYPRAWEPEDADGEAPGNVLVVGDHVVLATATRVDVYTDLAVARAKLDANEAAAPSDPAPRLTYAEVMFVAGDVPTAIAKLDEAAARLGGGSSMRPGPDRERLFNDALAFALKLTAGRPEGPAIVQQAADLFDRAARAAATPGEQVAYRIGRAKLFARIKDANNGVRVFQEILADPALRAVPTFDDRAGPTTAAAVAEQSIAALIVNAGRGCYIAYDLVAEEKFAAAKTAGDAGALLEVGRTYPNALVAARALVAAADAYEATGEHRLAGHVLRQALRKGAAGPARAAIVEGLARNYLALPGGIELATARLTKAVRPDDNPKVTQPMRLPDGTALAGDTFMAVLDELRKRGPDASAGDGPPALPDLRLAGRQVVVDPATGKKRFLAAFAPARPQDAIGGIESLVVPPVGMARHDRVIGFTGRALAVYVPGAARPLATFDAVNAVPRGAGWVGDDLVVWSDDAVWRLRPGKGDGADAPAVAWTATLAGLPSLPLTPDADDASDLPGVAAEGEMVNVNVMPPRLRRQQLIRMRAGRVRFQEAPAAAPAPPPGPERIIDLKPTATRVVLLTSTGRLAGLDVDSGLPAWQARLGERSPERLAVTDEFTVARAANDVASTLVVVDTFSGQSIARPRFAADGPSALANFALGADGTLVYTLADRLATKDLFEPWEGNPPNERIAEGGPGNAIFLGASRPDQLVVNDGLAAALSGGGMVRVYSLLTRREHLQQLATGSTEWDVGLRMVGSQLYAVSPKTYRSFDLVNPAPPDALVPALADGGTRPRTIRSSAVGLRHMVLFDTMGAGADEDPAPRAPAYRLWAYNRDRVNGVENGIIDHIEIVADRAGITAWQAVDGGLYYHTADRKLHFLKGAREGE